MKGKLTMVNGERHIIGKGFRQANGRFVVMCDKKCDCQKDKSKFRRFKILGGYTADTEKVLNEGVMFSNGTVVTYENSSGGIHLAKDDAGHGSFGRKRGDMWAWINWLDD